MSIQSYNVIGVMSGTSLDGIDLAHCSFRLHETWEYKIHHVETVPYNQKWFEALSNSIRLRREDLEELDRSYSIHLGKVVKSFMSKNNIRDIDFVASHGHTVFHQPEQGFTYQIGNKQDIANECQLKVICDFRVQDVKLGGQGAPLVPIGDKLLFNQYTFCLNLGGFANVSYDDGGQRIAFDICPANLVLNHFIKQLNLKYDDKGEVASSGLIHEELLEDLNRIAYYSEPPPKSLGLEWVQTHFLPLISEYTLSVKDILRTLVEHIAIQITTLINLKGSTVLVTGGGAYNTFLISRLKSQTKSKVVIPAPELIEFKEALVFAFLGVLRDRGEFNCLHTVTGASRNHSSGEILKPKSKNNN